MKVYLDNIPVQNLTKNLEEPTFNIRQKDEGGDNVFSYTGDLEFIEADYDYVYQVLKTDPNALSNRITLKFEDDCCNPAKTYEFWILAESLNWCENECRVTARAVEKSVSNEQIICLKNKMIYDDYNGFKNIQHPRMAYCNELRPNWMHHVLLIIAILLGFIMAILTPVLLVIGIIVSIINAMISALNSLIPGDGPFNPIDFDNDPSTNVFQEFINGYNQLMSWVVGCGRKHPSPTVKSYAQNVCGACNLTFKSSIFSSGSPYEYTVYVNAPINKGTQALDTNTHWLDDNKPLLSGTLFFDQIKKIFNADWKVKNNQLEFERKDLLTKNAIWLDFTTYSADDIKVCWSWKQVDKPSYLDFKYFKDAVNWVGAEAIDRWSDIVEWNSPYTPTQKGSLAPFIEFSACRFRDDGIDTDVLSFYKNAPFVGSIIGQYNNVMIMNSHTCYQPMLLIWDPRTGIKNSKVDGGMIYLPGYPNVGLNQFYNYPFWLDPTFPGNLYDNFFYIEDPRTNGFKQLQFKAELALTCQLKAAADIDGKVNTSEGISRDITEININLAEAKMTITGTV